MGVRIEIRVPQAYPHYCRALLTQIFAGYAVVVITKHFTEGQSGTFVLLVEPTRQGGEKELPVVIKIGPSHLLEQEWRAAQEIAGRLPDFVPISGQLASVAMTNPDGTITDYSAARYPLAGNGIFAIETLRNYALTASTAALWTILQKRLFQQLDQIWRTTDPPVQRPLNATYDRVLPVNLLLDFAEAVPSSPLLPLDATHDPTNYPQCQPGDLVQLYNFVITEIDATEQALTLDIPQQAGPRMSAYRLRIRRVAHFNQYKLENRVVCLTGRVVQTRQLLLLAAVRMDLPTTVDLTQPLLHLPDTHEQVPNPLLHWSSLLPEPMTMRLGTVHGDLNTGNMLIDVEAKSAFIIDCIHTHRDHALFDLARLESEMVLHLVAARFYEQNLPPTTIHDLYNWLDFVTKREPNPSGFFSVPQLLLQQMPALQSAFITLTTIRNAAHQYLAHPTQWREYYVALVLTLLGSLKFATLDRAPAGMNPKAVAFWGAATLLAQLEQSVNLMHIGWQRVAVHEVAASTKSSGDGKPSVYVDPTTIRYDQRQGVFFEGNESVKIEGNVITGGTVNTTNFHGPVSGPIHTGSGNISLRDNRSSLPGDPTTPPPPAKKQGKN